MRLRLARWCRLSVSDACPEPTIEIGDLENSFARSLAQRTTAAAPSLCGAQSSIRSGSETIPEPETASGLIGKGNCACGLCAAWAWFLTATAESISRVVPNSVMCACAIIACSDAKVAPCCDSHSSSAPIESVCADSESLTSVIFSAPPTTATSMKPPATAMYACRNASPPEAEAPSMRVDGTCAPAMAQ